MLSFLEIGILLFCAGILLFLLSLTSYSFRVKVSGEKKPYNGFIEIIIHEYKRFCSKTNELPEYKKQYNITEIYYNKEGGAYSPHLPMNEREKKLV